MIVMGTICLLFLSLTLFPESKNKYNFHFLCFNPLLHVYVVYVYYFVWEKERKGEQKFIPIHSSSFFIMNNPFSSVSLFLSHKKIKTTQSNNIIIIV